MMKTKILTYALCALAATFAMNINAETMAQEGLVPATTTNVAVNNDLMRPTHPALKLTPDKSEIINLSEAVERVIIGNSANVNVFMDTPTRLIVVPRVPGATHFTLMGEDGKIIMQRHVIVASPRENYVRVRRTCAMGGDDCIDTAVYYCEGMCHDIHIRSADDAASSSGGGSGLSGAFGGSTSAAGAAGAAPNLIGNPDPEPVE